MQPLVTVLLPVYNCEKYINECIDSILMQTYSNFELLIIDDCSSDTTVEKIKAYKDTRIKLQIKEKNSGYTDSLNWGVENANGEYIARMDGDDICMPSRFEEQVKILNENDDISICGSWAQIIGRDEYMKTPETNNQIFKKLLFQNAIIHPSVMAKKKIFKFYKYDRNFEPAEDFHLWTSLISEYNFYNIQKPLLYYRYHDNNISLKKSNLQKSNFFKALFSYYTKISDNNNNISFDDFDNFFNNKNYQNMTFIKIYKYYNTLKCFKTIDITNEIQKLKKNAMYILLLNNSLSDTKKIFVYLSFKDKIRFLNYYFKNKI